MEWMNTLAKISISLDVKTNRLYDEVEGEYETEEVHSKKVVK